MRGRDARHDLVAAEPSHPGTETTPAGLDEVTTALLEHKALMFRGTEFDDDARIAFASRHSPGGPG